jgi:hypothetical protein
MNMEPNNYRSSRCWSNPWKTNKYAKPECALERVGSRRRIGNGYLWIPQPFGRTYLGRDRSRNFSDIVVSPRRPSVVPANSRFMSVLQGGLWRPKSPCCLAIFPRLTDIDLGAGRMRSQVGFLIYRHSYRDRYIGLRDALSPCAAIPIKTAILGFLLSRLGFYPRTSCRSTYTGPTSHRWSPRTSPTAETCIPRGGPYESAWDWRVLVLVFFVT